jgi:hypothetical protein
MNVTFDALPWHDAQLLEILIDRRRPGECDEVRLQVVWPQGDHVTLLFRDCYAMTATMNFGVIADERVAAASEITEDPGLTSIRERWHRLGVPLDQLRCYRIETASTASVIQIYAKQFEIS